MIAEPATGWARAAAVCTAAAMAVFAAGLILWRSAPLIALIVIGILLAVPLRRAVARLEGAGLGRRIAAPLVALASVAALVVFGVAVLQPAAAQAVQLVTDAPALLEAFRRSPRVAALLNWVGAADVATQLKENAPALARSAVGGAASAAGGVASVLGRAMTVLAAMILFVVTRESPLQAAARLAPATSRSRWRALAASIEDELARYLAGLAAIVAIRGFVTIVALPLMQLPFFLALGLLAAATVLIPYVGAILRFAVLLGIALAARGLGTAAVVFVFLLAYDVVENGVLSPLVFRKVIDLSPLVQFLAVLFLGYHGGAAGAVLALPVTAAIHTIFSELRRERRGNGTTRVDPGEEDRERVAPDA